MLIPTLIISIFLTDPKLICFITDDDSRSLVLASLAEKMPKLLPDILAAARQIQDAYYRVKVLASLADKLSPELLLDVLTATRQIQFDYDRAQVLESLEEKLPPELLPDAWANARRIEYYYDRFKVLARLADKLPPELLLDVLTATRQIHDYDSRALVLASLAKKLSQIKKPLLFSYWQDTIKILSVGERLSLFDDIGIYYI